MTKQFKKGRESQDQREEYESGRENTTIKFKSAGDDNAGVNSR